MTIEKIKQFVCIELKRVSWQFYLNENLNIYGKEIFLLNKYREVPFSQSGEICKLFAKNEQLRKAASRNHSWHVVQLQLIKSSSEDGLYRFLFSQIDQNMKNRLAEKKIIIYYREGNSKTEMITQRLFSVLKFIGYENVQWIEKFRK